MGNTNFGDEAFLNPAGPMAFVCGPIHSWEAQQGGEPWPEGQDPDAMQIAVELEFRGRVFASGGPGEVLQAPDPGPWGLALRITDRRVARAAVGKMVMATGTKVYPDEPGPYPESEMVWREEIRFARIRTKPARDIETQGLSAGSGGLVAGASLAVFGGLLRRRNMFAELEAERTK